MTGHACKLFKSISGAKQAGEIWGSLHHKSPRNWGFKVSKLDERIHFFPKRQGLYCFGDTTRQFWICFELNSAFESPGAKTISKLWFQIIWPLTSFVGWRINLSGYIKQIQIEHGMETANAVKSPLSRTANLLSALENEEIFNHHEHKKYRLMIGILLYLVVCKKPDISVLVAVLERQFHSPISRHLALFNRIMRYVAGTVGVSLLYPRTCSALPQLLVVSVDADWGECKETRKSTSGFVIAINGTPIVRRTRKQPIITTESAESEYVALFNCAKHVCWMRNPF